MEKKFRLLLLLALLMTAVTGAWAQDAKHLITATYREQTRSLEQPLPYATTIGELYEAVTGQSFSGLISSMSAAEMTLTGITSNNTSVSIGELNGASTPVTVIADGKATISINFGSYAHGIFLSAASPLYAYMKDGVKDADKWTVKVGEGEAQALPIGGLKGDGKETVTLQYTGRLKVKGVKATSDAPADPTGKTVDLSTLTANYEAKDGDVLTGTLGANVKISIADGATVTLKDATINGGDDYSYKWAGLNCAGDATITLEGTNTVKGFYNEYPGIQVPMDKTLTIQGTGSLNARSNGYAAGIGGGYKIACGNITISGGTVEATGGDLAAGIGGGNSASCGNITINGGTITATGGKHGPGIGGGKSASCGNITIANTVTKVTATKGAEAPHSIGKGTNGTCGTVTIGGTKYWENNAAVNGGDTYLATSPLIYDPTAQAKPAAMVTLPLGEMTQGGDPLNNGSGSETYFSPTFKEGDQIALVHGGVKDVVTVGTPNSDGSAPITGDITVGADNEDIVLVYPADLVAVAVGGTAYTENTDVTNKFKTQEGTLAYIQNKLYIHQGTGKLAVSGASASLKANVSMASQIAIWKLTMKDDYDDDIYAQNVTVKVGGNTVAYASTTSPYFSPSIVYLALNPATMGTGILRIEAEGLGSTYHIEKSGVSLTAGKFYQSTLKMSEE